MEPVNILIVEDVLLTAEDIRMSLEKLGYAVCGVLTRGEDVIPFVQANPPDLVILDIKLAGKLDGIQVAEQLRKKHRLPVIFLTDIDNEKTISRARKVFPAAYLFKPFNERQLHASISTAFYNATHQLQAVPGKELGQEETNYPMKGYVFLRERDVLEKVKTTDILAIQAGRMYCDIYLRDGRRLVQAMSMGSLIRQLDSPFLLQVHRSWVVNVHEVKRIRGNTLYVGTFEVPISRESQEEVLQLFPVVR